MPQPTTTEPQPQEAAAAPPAAPSSVLRLLSSVVRLPPSVLRLPSSALWLALLPLAFLWFRFIDHLRIEWTLNEQYTYGWAVPFLCAYLLWRNLTYKTSGVRRQESGVSDPASENPQPSTLNPQPAASLPSVEDPDPSSVPGQLSTLNSQLSTPASLQPLAFLLAFLYLPTRLIQEANPEWRLVSWSLALIVVGITLLVLRSAVRSQESGVSRQDPSSVIHHPSSNAPSLPSRSSVEHPAASSGSDTSAFILQPLAFPILFFLIAVPWPTIIEGPLIQSLTRANAGTAVELVNLLGTPAIQHGNVIEVGRGLVGVDDACSGIRSFQASLMLALFFSLLYRLKASRALALCLAGFCFSFVFNVARTTLLTVVAAKQGIAAIDKWHDPAGVSILLACFLSLWLLSLWLQRQGREQQSNKATKNFPSLRSVENQNPPSVYRLPSSRTLAFSLQPLKKLLIYVPDFESLVKILVQRVRRRSRECFFPNQRPQGVPALAFLLWLLASEIATEAWYRWHERSLPVPVTWSLDLPRDNPSIRTLAFSEKTHQFLRFDEGTNATWSEPDGTRWQAIFLRWRPGRIAVHLAKTHTPQACLPAAGREVVSESKLQFTEVNGLTIPFRTYTVQDHSGTLHVFYCLWEDRRNDRAFAPDSLTYANRLAPVLAGRRNSGQRSLELAVWGIDDPDQAPRAFQEQLRSLLKRP